MSSSNFNQKASSSSSSSLASTTKNKNANLKAERKERKPENEDYLKWHKELLTANSHVLQHCHEEGAAFLEILMQQFHSLPPLATTAALSTSSTKPAVTNKKAAAAPLIMGNKYFTDFIVDQLTKTKLNNPLLVILYCLTNGTKVLVGTSLKVTFSCSIVDAVIRWKINENQSTSAISQPQFDSTIIRLSLHHALYRQGLSTPQKFFSLYFPETSSSSDLVKLSFIVDVYFLYNCQIFKHGVRVACLTGARDFIDFRSLLLPLVVHDFESLIHDLLTDRPHWQEMYLNYLQSLYFNGLQNEIERLQLPVPLMGNLPKQENLAKLCLRFANKYKISLSPELTRQLDLDRIFLAVRHFVVAWQKEKDLEKKLALENYLAVEVGEIQQKYPNYQNKFLAIVNRFQCVDYWQQVLKLMNEEKRKTEETSTMIDYEMLQAQLIELTNENKYFVPKSLIATQITMVDNPINFQQAVEHLQKCKKIGLDCELYQSIALNKQILATFQVAVDDHVFIFDMLRLPDLCDDELWLNFKCSIFANPNIIKIGYGLIDDLVKLKDCIAVMNPIEKSDYVCLVDLLKLEKNKEFDKYLPAKDSGNNNGPKVKGLAGLCFHALGKELKKSQTISNWHSRPLKPEQMIYAAFDALVLVDIHNHFENQGGGPWNIGNVQLLPNNPKDEQLPIEELPIECD